MRLDEQIYKYANTQLYIFIHTDAQVHISNVDTYKHINKAETVNLDFVLRRYNSVPHTILIYQVPHLPDANV